MASEGKGAKRPDAWKHAVAGCTAGLSTVLALQPLDVIKTRLQVQDGAGSLPQYRGTIDALRSMAREEGWRALYAGLTPALIGSGVAWGVYFFAYNAAKRRYEELTGQQRLSPLAHLASAAEAGSIVCFVTNPIWVVKTRLQLQRHTAMKAAATAATTALPKAGAPPVPPLPPTGPAVASAAAGASRTAASSAAAAAAGRAAAAVPRPPPSPQVAAYSGFIDCLTQIARTEGIAGLYKGLLPSLFLVSHGAIQFAVYEELKAAAAALRAYVRPLEGDGDGQSGSQYPRAPSSLEVTACGALSKLAASVATYPSQVVRSRLQQRMDARALRYAGVGDVLRTTLAREGVGGLYKGLLPNVLRVMPQSALTFLVYESVIDFLHRLD